MLIAEIKNKPVGYSINYIKNNVRVYKLAKLGHMSDLYIKKGYRGKGIAKQFRDLAWSWFKKKGMKYIAIGAHAENKVAQKIYHKWGFFDYHIEMRRKL